MAKKKTRRQELDEHAAERGFSVHTWSPGDGVTRYRFFHLPEHPHQSYYGPANGVYTALGLKEAYAFLAGAPTVRGNPWPVKYRRQGRKYDRCLASIGPGYNPFAVCGAQFKKSMGKRQFGEMLSARRRLAKSTRSNPARKRSSAIAKSRLTPEERHHLKIAQETLRMPDAMVGVMGGPSKTQARVIINELKRRAASRRRR